MTVSTCPYPGNVNPLYLTGYQFVINKLPELTYFVQETEIPGLSLGQSQVGNPLIASKVPGDTMEFSELQMQFIVDEDLKNWNAIYFWITGLGFPQNHEMYRRYMRASINKNLYSESSKGVSDGTLTLLDNFPINLSGLRLDSSITDATPAVGTVTFAYTYYSINKDVE